jgi:hypothetical protein
MISLARDPIATMYRVEVSGWDRNQTFFVEKSELEWNEEAGKHVLLTHAIPDGAVIFLRLIPYFSVGRSEAMAYETEFVATTLEGQHLFRLHQVMPHFADAGMAVN